MSSKAPAIKIEEPLDMDAVNQHEQKMMGQLCKWMGTAQSPIKTETVAHERNMSVPKPKGSNKKQTIARQISDSMVFHLIFICTVF